MPTNEVGASWGRDANDIGLVEEATLEPSGGCMLRGDAMVTTAGDSKVRWATRDGEKVVV